MYPNMTIVATTVMTFKRKIVYCKQTIYTNYQKATFNRKVVPCQQNIYLNYQKENSYLYYVYQFKYLYL